jgi:stearoyl-CoA desaturase (delta-9 desaturase)
VSYINGLIDLPWWGYVLLTLGLTHITIVAVTVYLHRAQAHRALDLHPALSHFFRFWLWFTTGMVTREWVAVHRKHHARTEQPGDPHSPHVLGIKTVFWRGAELYRDEAACPETVAKFSRGTPDDWVERNVYARHDRLGVTLLAITQIILFGPAGLAIWAIQMLWIPFWAAGVINGLGHWWGYRNFEPRDGSTNLTPLAVVVGGEELHNNHHAFPSSAKFSVKPWEFDIGWLYIRILSALRLARVRRVAPRPVEVAGKDRIDLDTVRAVVVGRLHVSARYAREVILPVIREEFARLDASYHGLLRRARRLLVREESRMGEQDRRRLSDALSLSARLALVYEYRQRLHAVWERTHDSQEKLLQSLQDWCAQAEASGVRALQDFARSLRSYQLAPSPHPA